MEADIGILGSSALEGGVPKWQVNVAVANDNDDVEPIGEIDAYQALGFASMPAPKDSSGHAEGVFLRDVGGRTAVCIGGRDTRNHEIVGKLGPGDCAMFATGPGARSQVQCKAKKRQVVMATDDRDNKTMMLLLDGKNRKAQWAARGAMIEISEDGDISLTNKDGAGILIQGGKIYILGELSLPGMTPGMALMQGPAVGYPVAPAGVLTPCLGVSK